VLILRDRIITDGFNFIPKHVACVSEKRTRAATRVFSLIVMRHLFTRQSVSLLLRR